MLAIWLAIVLIAREAVTGAMPAARTDVATVLLALVMLWIVRWR
jgi:hypothetical protein